MNVRQFLILTFGAALIAAGIWFGFVLTRPGLPPEAPPPPPPPPPTPTPIVKPVEPPPAPVTAATNLVNQIFARIREGGLSPEDLDAFRKALLSQPPGEAIVAILRFLVTGQDAITGEAFSLGENGELVGAPTFRVLLLDLLGRLCRGTKGNEAATAARALLQRKTSPEEWAVALRNVGWATPNDLSYIAEKTRELIRHEPWRHQPSAGFQEAFDFIVYARDVAMIPDLAQMLRNDEDPLQTTAAVTLDRLAEFAPLEAMNYLNQHRTELADKPFLRADYFSKADLSQPAQRSAMETYLARSDVAFPEKAKMIAALASPGSFAADTLLTTPPPDEFSPQREAALRRTVTDWITTSRFPALMGPLQQLQRRIGN